MSTIVTRAGKGTALTWTEMDANFTNLNNDKYESGANPTFGTVTATTYNQLPVFNGLVDGIVNAGANGTTKYLREDGSWEVPPGTAGSVAGSNGQIQFNDSGNFGADADFTWDKTANQFDVTGTSFARGASAGWFTYDQDLNSRYVGLYMNANSGYLFHSVYGNAVMSFNSTGLVSMPGDLTVTGFVNGANGLIGKYVSLDSAGSSPTRGWYSPSTTEMRGNVAGVNMLNIKYDASYSFVAGLGVVPSAWSNTILPAYAFEFGDRGAVAQYSGSAYFLWNTKIDSAYAEVARTASGTPAAVIVGGGAITMKAAATNPGAGSAITFTDLLIARGNSDMDVSLPCGRLKFPATQVASSDANTLDDYEEGTWTPTVTSQGGSLTSYTVQTCAYTKIGRMVAYTINFTITNAGTGTGGLVVTLPFTSAIANMGCGREGGVNGYQLQFEIGTSNSGILRKYDNLTPIVTNGIYSVTGTFFV